MTKNNKKKIVVTAATCALVGAMAIGGTMAYLTDNETTTNTFTVGKVQIDLLERNYPGNGTADVQKLVPNQEVQKDPTVKNTGINDAIAFIRVTVPKKEVTLVGDDGTKSTKQKRDMFYLKDTEDAVTVHANKFDPNWISLSNKNQDNTNDSVYVFGYNTKLAKGNETNPLFDKIQLINYVEGEITEDPSANDIKIEAFAIQADNIINIDTSTLNQMTLENVYDVFITQNDSLGAGKAADSSGELHLNGTTILP